MSTLVPAPDGQDGEPLRIKESAKSMEQADRHQPRWTETPEPSTPVCLVDPSYSSIPHKRIDSFLAIIAEFCNRAYETGEGRPKQTFSEMWIEVSTSQLPTLAQGWKLHISAGPCSAVEVLRASLPVLLAERADFKVAASIRVLEYLNEANAGLSQIGKFITVYPRDDTHAIRLAVALDKATRGMRGPAVPSDHPLAKGSLVSYRYGGFDGRHMQTPLGATVSVISKPSGELVEDLRLSTYHSPEWVADPFIAAGVAVELPKPGFQFVGSHYLPIATLHSSFGGTVQLAVDIDAPRRCVLKRAWRDAMLDEEGHDARDHLRHEATVLSRLAPDPRFPEMYDLFAEDDDLFLVLEDMEGQTLEAFIGGFSRTGCCPPLSQVVVWGRELADMLGSIHAKGLIYGDLKSTNVIVTPGGELRLLDFGTTHDPTGKLPAFGKGTVGYMSPQRERNERPTVADDVYSLGALLFFLATCAEPSSRPRLNGLVAEQVRLLNPSAGIPLASVIAACLRENSAERFQSMAEVEERLIDVASISSVTPAAFGMEEALETEMQARSRFLGQAKRLLETLCEVAEPAPSGGGLIWVSQHDGTGGFFSRDLSVGDAGSVLALAELVGHFGESRHRQTLAQGANWLASRPRPVGSVLPGLYVGEAGCGAALLRAGQVLSDTEFIAAAADCGRWIAALPYVSPDLYNGTAGRLRFHLLLWDETHDEEHLRNAIEAGNILITAAESVSANEVRWRIPAGYEGLSGCANLGYAHGAAGIADGLLDLFEVTDDERFLSHAQGAGRWLERLAVPVLEDSSGLAWPSDEGEDVFSPMWCHGASGIARFFLHAAQLSILPNAERLAQRAARSVARGARWAGTTQCHGLAGNIELLLDFFQSTGDRAYLKEAHSLARILETFAFERKDLLVWPSEEPTVVCPDYMVGYAGVALCLLRLADPKRLPHQLSRRGFRHRPEPAIHLHDSDRL